MNQIEYLRQFIGDKASDVGAFLLEHPQVSEALKTGASRSSPFGVTGPMLLEALATQQPFAGAVNAVKSAPEQVVQEMAQPATPAAPVTSTPSGGTFQPITGRGTVFDQKAMPVGYTGTGEGGFGERVAAMPAPSPAPAQKNEDPFLTAIMSLLSQQPERTAAVPVRSTADVVNEFNARNPKANPENKSGFDKALDFVGLGRGPAQLNPAELLKLQADLGISTEAAIGENVLNRWQRQVEHNNRVTGNINNRDILGVLAGKSNIRDQGQVQKELQSQATEGQSRLAKEQAGYRQQEISQTAQAQTSPSAVRASIAERNPEAMSRQAYENALGMKVSDQEWQQIVNANNKQSSPMEQFMLALLAQNIANRGAPRGQGQPVNTQALNK